LPNYAFLCPKCGTEFEEWLGFDDEKVQLCPKCGELSPVKIYPVPAHIGWAVSREAFARPTPPKKLYPVP